MIAAAWFVLRGGGGDSSASTNPARPAAASVEQRLAAVEKRLATLSVVAAQLAKEAKADRATAATALKTAKRSATGLSTVCAQQLQQEIDDLRGYVVGRGSIQRRVTPACNTALAPRYGG